MNVSHLQACGKQQLPAPAAMGGNGTSLAMSNARGLQLVTERILEYAECAGTASKAKHHQACMHTYLGHENHTRRRCLSVKSTSPPHSLNELAGKPQALSRMHCAGPHLCRCARDCRCHTNASLRPGIRVTTSPLPPTPLSSDTSSNPLDLCGLKRQRPQHEA